MKKKWLVWRRDCLASGWSSSLKPSNRSHLEHSSLYVCLSICLLVLCVCMCVCPHCLYAFPWCACVAVTYVSCHLHLIATSDSPSVHHFISDKFEACTCPSGRVFSLSLNHDHVLCFCCTVFIYNIQC